MTAREITIDLAIRYGFQLLGALVILAVGWLVARWVGNLTGRWLEQRRMEPPARKLLVHLVRIVVLVFAMVVALDKFGFQVAPLVAGIGVAGLGIGFALQGVLSNLVAGLTIIFTKPFRVGEYVEVLGVHGQVSAIELSTTTLAQVDQSRVVIPNRKIVGEILHNYGRIRQLHLSVGVAYGTDLERALAAARAEVEADPRVLKDPAPVIGVAALADSAITLAVRPWVSVDDCVAAEAALYQALVERFRTGGIEIPFPQCEVRMVQAQ
ncbi:MAG: mechanosensitive ion channel [Candidatus Rokubacteria bacterium]|nr:mechanosensitive ion channel [Candidatus Rokubacteria bacterium]